MRAPLACRWSLARKDRDRLQDGGDSEGREYHADDSVSQHPDRLRRYAGGNTVRSDTGMANAKIPTPRTLPMTRPATDHR
jgi:hypothetical protein